MEQALADSLSLEAEWQQVSLVYKTLLSIRIDLNNDKVWKVSIRVSISNTSRSVLLV